MESDGLYEVVNLQSIVNSLDEDDSSESSESSCDVAIVGNFDTTSLRESILKFKIVQEHWIKLYSAEKSLRLQRSKCSNNIMGMMDPLPGKKAQRIMIH